MILFAWMPVLWSWMRGRTAILFTWLIDIWFTHLTSTGPVILQFLVSIIPSVPAVAVPAHPLTMAVEDTPPPVVEVWHSPVVVVDVPPHVVVVVRWLTVVVVAVLPPVVVVDTLTPVVVVLHQSLLHPLGHPVSPSR